MVELLLGHPPKGFAGHLKRIIAATLTVFAALFMVAEIGQADADPTDAGLLRELRTAPDNATRVELLAALADRHSEAVRRTLESIAAEPSTADRVRMQAVCSLAGSATRESVPVLLQILEMDLKERRGFWACAIPLLGDLKDRRAIPLLTTIANLDADQLIGMDHMAIEALTKAGDERELTLFMAKAHVWQVRLAVIRKLAGIASPLSTDLFIGALSDTEDADVMKAAESGLLAIGEPAAPGLKKAIAEKERGQKFLSRAEAILKRIGSQQRN